MRAGVWYNLESCWSCHGCVCGWREVPTQHLCEDGNDPDGTLLSSWTTSSECGSGDSVSVPDPAKGPRKQLKMSKEGVPEEELLLDTTREDLARPL